MRVPGDGVKHVLGDPGQVILGVGVHPGGDAQPRGELVPVLYQRPHAPRPAVTEATERLLNPGVPSLQPRQFKYGKVTPDIGFLIESQTLQRADRVINPLRRLPKCPPVHREPIQHPVTSTARTVTVITSGKGRRFKKIKFLMPNGLVVAVAGMAERACGGSGRCRRTPSGPA